MLDSKFKTPNINPKKLMNSKWSAVAPLNKEKHFIAINLIELAQPLLPIAHILIEAVHSKRKQILPWLELSDASIWQRGWH